jgi:alkylated DNA repair dioxygenase AlkB
MLEFKTAKESPAACARPFWVAVSGTRRLPTRDMQAWVEAAISVQLTRLAKEHAPRTIGVLEGGAHGVDRAAANVAKASPGTWRHRCFPARWKTLGAAAGPMRNREMLQAADFLLALPSPESRGTLDAMNQARKMRIPGLVYALQTATLVAAWPEPKLVPWKDLVTHAPLMYSREFIEEVTAKAIRSPIPGALYVPDFIDAATHAALFEAAAEGPWDTTLQRKTQQYGFTYNYRDFHAPLQAAAALPDYAQVLRDLVVEEICTFPTMCGFLPPGSLDDGCKAFQQLIINHYAPGQGIGSHVDHVKHFGELIAIVSTGAPAPMVFTPPKHGPAATAKPVTQTLKPGSLLLLTGPARWHWRHSLSVPKATAAGLAAPHAGQRISFTFRMVRT